MRTNRILWILLARTLVLAAFRAARNSRLRARALRS